VLPLQLVPQVPQWEADVKVAEQPAPASAQSP
jgi:hypothetical protein